MLLHWCIQHDLPVIPKPTHRERIHETAQIFDFALSNEDDDEHRVDRLHPGRASRTHR
jgi:diketogulonate reductase-like aldo/keto reductase